MTFLFEVTGDSMENAGISAGDMVVVDCKLKAEHGNIVLAEVNGEITLKRLQMLPNHRTKMMEMTLIPDNPKHPPVKLSDFDDVHIFGVAIRKMRIEELL
jgi:DNA polymerase V